MEKKVLKNSIFNVGYRALNVLFPLITSIYVSRIIGPAGVGRVDYAQNILSYFLIFASTGIPTYGIREIARNSGAKLKYSKSFSELVVINAVTTTVCIAGYIALILSVPAFCSDKAVFFAVGGSLFLNYFNIDWFYAGMEEYVYIAVRSTIVKLLSLLALLLFVHTRNDVVNYALITAFGLSAYYLFDIINVRKKISFSFRQLDLKKHIKPVFVLLLTMLATDLYNQIDITMMGNTCSKAEIGCYSYAIRIVRIVTSIPTAVSATMLPRLSQYYAEKKDSEFQNFTNKVMRAVILLSVPGTVGLVLCSRDIITVLYGAEFSASVPLIRILSPIIFIISVSYLCGSVVLTAINKEKYLLIATLTGAGINIALNSVLIPIYHGKGAAVASVAAELGVLLLHYLFSRRYIRYRFAAADNVKAFFAAAVMAGGVWAIHDVFYAPALNLLASVLVGAGVYFSVLFVTKHELFMKGISGLHR